jgi:hypothetical protein
MENSEAASGKGMASPKSCKAPPPTGQENAWVNVCKVDFIHSKNQRFSPQASGPFSAGVSTIEQDVRVLEIVRTAGMDERGETGDSCPPEVQEHFRRGTAAFSIKGLEFTCTNKEIDEAGGSRAAFTAISTSISSRLP